MTSTVEVKIIPRSDSQSHVLTIKSQLLSLVIVSPLARSKADRSKNSDALFSHVSLSDNKKDKDDHEEMLSEEMRPSNMVHLTSGSEQMTESTTTSLHNGLTVFTIHDRDPQRQGYATIGDVLLDYK